MPCFYITKISFPQQYSLCHMSSSCHFDLRSILSLRETSVGCFYNEALEDECDSTVNSTVVWTNIQFDAFFFFFKAACCHVQCVILLVRKLDHGIIIIYTASLRNTRRCLINKPAWKPVVNQKGNGKSKQELCQIIVVFFHPYSCFKASWPKYALLVLHKLHINTEWNLSYLLKLISGVGSVIGADLLNFELSAELCPIRSEFAFSPHRQYNVFNVYHINLIDFCIFAYSYFDAAKHLKQVATGATGDKESCKDCPKNMWLEHSTGIELHW